MSDDNNDKKSEESDRTSFNESSAAVSAQGDEKGKGRRTFIRAAGGIGMAGGLIAGYGTFASFAGRYLYPAKDVPSAWLYVSRVLDLKPGEALEYSGPAGESINVARQGEGETADDFIALSSTCPHLGCKVHWQGKQNRFFCPCHNGVFDPKGKGIEGPPAKAGQSLSRYQLKIDGGLLYIEVPVPKTATVYNESDDCSVSGDGHDPCLDVSGQKRRG